jgi:hypothetical protein
MFKPASVIVDAGKLESAFTEIVILFVPVTILHVTVSVPDEFAIASPALLFVICVVYTPALFTAAYVTWSE